MDSFGDRNFTADGATAKAGRAGRRDRAAGHNGKSRKWPFGQISESMAGDDPYRPLQHQSASGSNGRVRVCPQQVLELQFSALSNHSRAFEV